MDEKLKYRLVQATVIVTSYFIAGITFVYYHYVFMPQYAWIWTYYGFLIATVPVWFVCGLHTLIIWLYCKHSGITYKYTFSVPYLLFVTIMILYGMAALTVYRMTHVDIRVLIPIIFLPALSIKILEPPGAHIPEGRLLALIITFVFTMSIVLYLQSLGGLDKIFSHMSEHRSFMPHGLYGVALYGLFYCLVECLPISIGGVSFDAYEIYKYGDFVDLIYVLIIAAACLYVLIFDGYLKWFMYPLT